MAAFRGGSDDPSYILVINTHPYYVLVQWKKKCVSVDLSSVLRFSSWMIAIHLYLNFGFLKLSC